MSTDLIADLEQRGLVHQATSPELRGLLCAAPATVYIGFDPTAASLHLGSLLPALALARVQRAGHRPIALIGGGTGLIGDPSGKDGERGMLTPEQVAAHAQGIRGQLERFLDFAGPRGALVVDNADWLGRVGLLEFLRDVGKHFTVNQMIVRDSVRPRIEDPSRSISFTEFSYMLLQAYDYLELFDRHGCTLQIGGSDQWGNIVSGCDLIRRKRGAVTHGLTMPLLTRSDGRKFGKSEQGNVWLDAALTSPYQLYQFLWNTEDADVLRLLRALTLLPPAQIDELAAEQARAPQRREAQRVLAAEVTRLVHGAEALARAERASQVLFSGGDWASLRPEELAEALAGSPRTALPRGALGTEAAAVVALVAAAGLAPSRGQARQALASGAISVNDVKVEDLGRVLRQDDLLAGRYVVLRRGKKAYHVIDVGEP